MGTSFAIIFSYANTQGEHTFTVFEAGGSGRVMKLSGANRTYSHTAEPRNVKFAGGVKDWPIKKETKVLIDQTYYCISDTEYLLINEYSGTADDFAKLIVEVNGEIIPYTPDVGYATDDYTIYYNPVSIYLQSYITANYQIKITQESTIVAEDFKEAVEAVGGGGESNIPNLEEAQYKHYYALTGDRFSDNLHWTEIPSPNMDSSSENGAYTVNMQNGTQFYDKLFQLLPSGMLGQMLTVLVWNSNTNCFDFKRFDPLPVNEEIPIISQTTTGYLPLPTSPGEYKLKATQSGSALIYSWEPIS